MENEICGISPCSVESYCSIIILSIIDAISFFKLCLMLQYLVADRVATSMCGKRIVQIGMGLRHRLRIRLHG